MKSASENRQCTSAFVLGQLLAEIDNAGAALIAEQDCSSRHGGICGLRTFMTEVAKSAHEARAAIAKATGQ